MFNRTVRNHRVRQDPAGAVRRWMPAWLAGLLLLAVTPLGAQDAKLPPVSVGAGVRTSFVHTETDGADSTDKFPLDSVRLYVSGPVTDKIKFMFNTEYNGATNSVSVLDAVGQFEFSNQFNIWAGRFLPPSDRSNLYGPYYAHHWAIYTDGVQDGYPFIFQGRDNGVVYWGQFDKVKVSAGAFDGSSATGNSTVLGAGRIQVDFWDPEPGYYLNGTYYGGKNLLAVGVAGQVQGSDRNAYSVDFLLERKLSPGGTVSVEAEWAKYDGLGGYSASYVTDQGGYLLASYLFPQKVGVGQFEILGKFAQARFSQGVAPVFVDFHQNTTEVNLNYVIKEFNARVMIFYKDTRYNVPTPGRADDKQVGVGLQLQM